MHQKKDQTTSAGTDAYVDAVAVVSWMGKRSENHDAFSGVRQGISENGYWCYR